jgi:hypothetical protein
MKSNMVVKIIGGIIGLGLLAFIAIQLVPVSRTNPPIKSQPKWDSPQTEALARRACFDCHSNETKWPWYSYIAPVSWSVADHVTEGRKKFNMSEWEPGDGDEAAKEVEEGGMPLSQYLLAHPEARLTAEEQKQFIAGLNATFGGEGASGSTDSASSEEGDGDADKD